MVVETTSGKRKKHWKSDEKCELCGQNVDYIKVIFNLKEEFLQNFGIYPSHLIVNKKVLFQMECSKSLLDRLLTLEDCTNGSIGSVICNLKIISTEDIEGFSVAFLN